jgi:hypothetical protein
MEDHLLKAAILFSEASKKSLDAFEKDAIAIYAVANNRLNDTKRWGYGSFEEVVTDRAQFTGYGTDEFNKVMKGNLTPEEEKYFKKALQIIKGYDSGMITDPTGGADHYFNPKLSNPDWGRLTEEKMVGEDGKYYPETYSTSGHSFRKEKTRWSSARKGVAEYQQALSDKGFDVGEIDGLAGERTKAAVKAFQEQSGLTADGIVGKKTRAVLFGG